MSVVLYLTQFCAQNSFVQQEGIKITKLKLMQIQRTHSYGFMNIAVAEIWDQARVLNYT